MLNFATPKGTASELISPPPVWRRVGFLYRNHVTPCHYPDPKLGKMVQKALYIERIGLGTPKIPQKPPKSRVPPPPSKNSRPHPQIQNSKPLTQKFQPNLKNLNP